MSGRTPTARMERERERNNARTSLKTRHCADLTGRMGRHANPQAAAAATLAAQHKDAATIAALQQQLDTLTAHLDEQNKTHAAQLAQSRIEADEQERKHAMAISKLERQHAIRIAEITGKRGTAPTFARTGSMPMTMARATSLVRASSRILDSTSHSSHAADSNAAPSSSSSDASLLRLQLSQKDAELSSLQVRFDTQSLELHKSLQSCSRLQTHVDLINRQLRCGEDYKTLLKYATVKGYVRQYREYVRAREMHRALAELMAIVADQECTRSGGTGTRGSTTKRSSTVSSPTKGAAAANPQSSMPLQTFSLTQPAGSSADSPALPVVQTSLSAEPSLVYSSTAAAAAASTRTSPRRSSAAATSSSSFLFADLAAEDSTGHGGASGGSGGSGAQNEVAEWIASDRSLWSAEKTGFAKLASLRRERGDRLAFQLQYALQPAYREPAAATSAASASSAPASSSSASSFTAPSSVTPSAHLSRLESQRLRESEKRRRAMEEAAGGLTSSSQPPRTFNAWTHWGAKHAALVAEAPALLSIALQESYARESTARATTKLWQQRNTQLLLDCAALQKEKGVVLTGSRKESTRVQQLEAALKDALDKVCVCTKIAEGMNGGSTAGQCLCDCVEDCKCAATASHSQSQSQSQTARTKQRTKQRRMDQQQWRAETAAKFDAAAHSGASTHEESKTANSTAAASAAAPPSPVAALNASSSLASLTSQFGTSLGGGSNARTHDLLNEHSNFPRRRSRRPSRSQHASPSPNRNLQHSFSASELPSSFDAQQPRHPLAQSFHAASTASRPSSHSTMDASSVPFLQRIIRTLRSRLFFSRSIILRLQADKQAAALAAANGSGKHEEPGSQHTQEEHKVADSSKRTTTTSSAGSTVHPTPPKPHPPHTERSHVTPARSVHRTHHSSRPSSSHGSPGPRASSDPFLPPLHSQGSQQSHASPAPAPAPAAPSHAQLLSRQHASVINLSQPLETAACPSLSLSSSTRAGLTERLSTDLAAEFQRSVSQIQAAAASSVATPATSRRSKQQYQLHPSPPPQPAAHSSLTTPAKRHSWSSHPLAPMHVHAALSSSASRSSVGVTASSPQPHRSSAKVHLLQSMSTKVGSASSAAASSVAPPASAAMVV